MALADSRTTHLAEKEKPRLLYIENLRILLIILVILHHLSITYGAPGGWYYHEFSQNQLDTLTTIVMVMFVAVNQAFFMGLFFFIAGYFTPASFDRKGGAAFLKDKLLRLGIPIVFYMVVISPTLRYFLDSLSAGAGLTLRDWFAQYFTNLQRSDIGPLWFVESLLIFSFVYDGCRILLRRGGDSGKMDSALPENWKIVFFAFLIGIVTFLVRVWFPVGSVFQPINLQFFYFPQYIAMFSLGIAANRRNWLAQVSARPDKTWPAVALLLVLFLPVLFVLSGGLTGNITPALGGVHWQSFVYSVWEQLVCLGMSISLLGFFYRTFNRQGDLAKAMSASVYTVFILHTPVLVFLAVSLRAYSLHPLIKFVLVAPLAVALCFVISNVVRKLPLARQIL
jgi:glucan biosynthesis protein C